MNALMHLTFGTINIGLLGGIVLRTLIRQHSSIGRHLISINLIYHFNINWRSFILVVRYEYFDKHTIFNLKF